MIVDKIDKIHKPWKMYHGKEDKLDSTHTLVEVDGPFGLYNMAIEIPDEKIGPIMKLMDKEADAANRFSLTDGIIQGEFEIWDGDYEKRHYFCVDFTLDQAIKFSKQRAPSIGYVPVGKPQVTVGAQKVFTLVDLQEFIRMKMELDAHPNRPPSWKVG